MDEIPPHELLNRSPFSHGSILQSRVTSMENISSNKLEIKYKYINLGKNKNRIKYKSKDANDPSWSLGDHLPKCSWPNHRLQSLDGNGIAQMDFGF